MKPLVAPPLTNYKICITNDISHLVGSIHTVPWYVVRSTIYCIEYSLLNAYTGTLCHRVLCDQIKPILYYYPMCMPSSNHQRVRSMYVLSNQRWRLIQCDFIIFFSSNFELRNSKHSILRSKLPTVRFFHFGSLSTWFWMRSLFPSSRAIECVCSWTSVHCLRYCLLSL